MRRRPSVEQPLTRAGGIAMAHERRNDGSFKMAE